jgi:hypothetical protein
MKIDNINDYLCCNFEQKLCHDQGQHYCEHHSTSSEMVLSFLDRMPRYEDLLVYGVLYANAVFIIYQRRYQAFQAGTWYLCRLLTTNYRTCYCTVEKKQ